MYISVKEASELTGKSSTTIYRLCKKRIKTRFVKKEDNKLLIDRDFVIAAYPPEYETVDVVLTEDINNEPINLLTDDVVLNEQDIEKDFETPVSDYEIELSKMLLIDEKDEPTLVDVSEIKLEEEKETSDDEWQNVDLEYSNNIEFEIENTANESFESSGEITENNSDINDEEELEKPKTYFKNVTSKDVLVKVAMGIVIISGFLVALYFMSL